ncbi:MAG: hypothetical protein IK106_04200 [Clostridiales bacterium]|nr:hypothetical protein [Clostridiales bacterium]
MRSTFHRIISSGIGLILILSLILSLSGCFFHPGKPGVFEAVEITADDREALDELENAILQDPAIKEIRYGCHKGSAKEISTELSMDLTLEKSIDKESAEELMKSVVFPRLANNGDVIQILLSSGDWNSLRINFVESGGSMPACYSSDETSGFQVWKDDGKSFDLKDFI